MRLAKPLLFDDTYTGPRWRYGHQYRHFACRPDGFILDTKAVSDDPRCPFGTIDYARELTADEVATHQFVPFGLVEGIA